jgi:hypothetical protein
MPLQPVRLWHDGAGDQLPLPAAAPVKGSPGFASDRAKSLRAHDLFAKPLTLWRIMR